MTPSGDFSSPPPALIRAVHGHPGVHGDVELRRAHGAHDPEIDMIVGMDPTEQGMSLPRVGINFQPIVVSGRAYEIAVHPGGTVVYWREQGVVTRPNDTPEF
jgi:hypothetical protein